MRRRALALVVVLLAACGDNLAPVMATPDAAPPVTMPEWRIVTVTPPLLTHAAWDPDRGILVASDGSATWEQVDGVWQPRDGTIQAGTVELYWDPARHQVVSVGSTFFGGAAEMEAWNRFDWHGVRDLGVIPMPIAAAYDPLLHGPVVISAAGSSLTSYLVSPDAVTSTGVRDVPNVQTARAAYDAPSRSVILAVTTFDPPGELFRVRGNRWTSLPGPGSLGDGFALATIDGAAELLVDGTVYRLDGDAWTPVSTGLPLDDRPTTLWQPGSGERHALYSRGEYVEHAGAWIATPRIYPYDYVGIARAPDADGYTLFATRSDFGMDVAFGVWQLARATVTPRVSAVPPSAPNGRYKPATVYSRGRGADLVISGTEIFSPTGTTGSVLTWDGETFEPLLDDEAMITSANQAVENPERAQFVAINRRIVDSTPQLMTLDDDALAWEPGPPLPQQWSESESLAYDPSMHRPVISQPPLKGEGPFHAQVYDLINGTWVFDSAAPLGALTLAGDERHGLVALTPNSKQVWERRTNVWTASTPLPVYPSEIFGTAYDLEHHELAVLASVRNGIVVFVRSDD